MITYDISLGSLIVGVVGTLLSAFILYLSRKVSTVIELIHTHDENLRKFERILFGDPDIQEWEGLVKISLANKKYSINDRRAFIILISKLCKNKALEMDNELTEAIDLLKKE
jgi:hypothetical protein